MASFFDLHLHTVKGSSDSSLSPEELVREATRIGLTGVCLTEHSGWRDKDEFERFARGQELILIRALEVDTEFGHIITLGLDGYATGYSRVRELRRAVLDAGGYMIAAHPFRNLFNPPPYNRNLLYRDPSRYPSTPQEAISHPIFELLDDVEVVNGANTEEENRFALEVTRLLGRPGSGGSDAHSTHGIGRGVTAFHGEVRSEAEFLEALRAGAYTPAEGFNVGRLRYFGQEAVKASQPPSSELPIHGR